MIVAAALVAACGTTAPNTSPSPTTSTPHTTPTPTPTSMSLKMFYVADTGTDLRLYREQALVPDDGPPGLAALRYLVAHKPVDPDYSSLWPTTTVIKGITMSGSEATVDLAPVQLQVGASSEQMAIEQLLWTLTAASPGVKSMRITINGKPVESLAGHVDATQAFSKPAAYEVVATVWMLKPEQGATVSSRSFTLSGMACTFEAAVVWSIRKGTTTVRKGAATAAEACPAWSPWSVEINGLQPGTYTAEVDDFSAKDGSLIAKDTKTFTVE